MKINKMKINKMKSVLWLFYLSQFSGVYEELIDLSDTLDVADYNRLKKFIPKVPKAIKPKPSNAYEHEAERHKTLIISIHRRG